MKLLPKRLKHAQAVLSDSKDKLDKLIASSPGAFFRHSCVDTEFDTLHLIAPFSMVDVQRWISQERENMSCER